MMASAEIDDRGTAPRAGSGGLRMRRAFEPTRSSGSILAQAYQRAVPVARCEVGRMIGYERERRRLA
jgi:hypothetical protein